MKKKKKDDQKQKCKKCKSGKRVLKCSACGFKHIKCNQGEKCSLATEVRGKPISQSEDEKWICEICGQINPRQKASPSGAGLTTRVKEAARAAARKMIKKGNKMRAAVLKKEEAVEKSKKRIRKKKK